MKLVSYLIVTFGLFAGVQIGYAQNQVTLSASTYSADSKTDISQQNWQYVGGYGQLSFNPDSTLYFFNSATDDVNATQFVQATSGATVKQATAIDPDSDRLGLTSLSWTSAGAPSITVASSDPGAGKMQMLALSGGMTMQFPSFQAFARGGTVSLNNIRVDLEGGVFWLTLRANQLLPRPEACHPQA